MKNEYIVVTGTLCDGLNNFAKKVNDKLEEGFYVCGNFVAVESKSLGMIYFQPMQKTDTDK